MTVRWCTAMHWSSSTPEPDPGLPTRAQAAPDRLRSGDDAMRIGSVPLCVG